jgi:hypothetical protein
MNEIIIFLQEPGIAMMSGAMLFFAILVTLIKVADKVK